VKIRFRISLFFGGFVVLVFLLGPRIELPGDIVTRVRPGGLEILDDFLGAEEAAYPGMVPGTAKSYSFGRRFPSLSAPVIVNPSPEEKVRDDSRGFG
jgi:hypothetical protein